MSDQVHDGKDLRGMSLFQEDDGIGERIMGKMGIMG
jgi:hypothetical protein